MSCREEPEDRRHLFYECQKVHFTKGVGDGVRRRIPGGRARLPGLRKEAETGRIASNGPFREWALSAAAECSALRGPGGDQSDEDPLRDRAFPPETGPG